MQFSTEEPVQPEPSIPEASEEEGEEYEWGDEQSDWVTDLLQLVRGLVRPVITFGVVASYLALLFLDKTTVADTMYDPLVQLVVLFWFVDRAVRKGT